MTKNKTTSSEDETQRDTNLLRCDDDDDWIIRITNFGKEKEMEEDERKPNGVNLGVEKYFTCFTMFSYILDT